MATNFQKRVIICSTTNAIKKAKIYGKLDLCSVGKYQLLADQLEYNKNITGRENIFDNLQDIINDVQYSSDDISNDVRAVLPDTPYYHNENGELVTDNGVAGGGSGNNIAASSDFTVTDITSETLFGVGDEFDMYIFKIADFENAYSDNNDGDFYAIKIYRNDLDGMSLRYKTGSTTGNWFGENNSSITILKSQIPNWSLYANPSSTNFIHDIQYSIIDLVGNTQVESNISTLTVDRVAFSGNQPATIGDNTESTSNRSVKTLTLAMFTTNLTPPYNDPDGDLIDAIRLDEISTANKGKFYLNGNEVVVNQIITREDINAGLFTYESPNQDDIWADAFNFSARDEGTLQWVT